MNFLPHRQNIFPFRVFINHLICKLFYHKNSHSTDLSFICRKRNIWVYVGKWIISHSFIRERKYYPSGKTGLFFAFYFFLYYSSYYSIVSTSQNPVISNISLTVSFTFFTIISPCLFISFCAERITRRPADEI